MPCEFCEAAADGLVALSEELEAVQDRYDSAESDVKALHEQIADLEKDLEEAEDAIGEEEIETLANVKAAFQAYLIAQGYPAAPIGSISPELDALVDLLV